MYLSGAKLRACYIVAITIIEINKNFELVAKEIETNEIHLTRKKYYLKSIS